MLDKDTILLIDNTAIKIPKQANPTCQLRPKRRPRPVATALPPFQLSHTGHMWPANEDNPAAICHESLK